MVFSSLYERLFVGLNAISQKMSHAAAIPERESTARYKTTLLKQKKSSRLNPESAYTVARIPIKDKKLQQMSVVSFMWIVCVDR